MKPALILQRSKPGYAAQIGLALVFAALTGCATGPRADRRDPLEPLNRSVYQFNDAVDIVVIKPVATLYRDVLPSMVRRGVGNFFNNLQDGWSFVNNSMQFKGVAATDSLVRFGVNTLIGLGGILDVASEMQVERHTRDFGDTLGYWGVGPGPYLVIPVFGPSTLRDAAAQVVDIKGDLSSLTGHVATRNSVTSVRLVDKRANLLQATEMLDQIALDKYTFTRDSYLQRRRSSIFDGNPPDEELSVESLPP
jgi:phospholipid-binding lipoprotein MlaA